MFSQRLPLDRTKCESMLEPSHAAREPSPLQTSDRKTEHRAALPILMARTSVSG